MGNLKNCCNPEDGNISIKKVERLSEFQIDLICKLAIKGMCRGESLSDICKRISTRLNIKYNQRQNWLCIASSDHNMCGYISNCKGYMQFSLNDYYFLAATTYI